MSSVFWCFVKGVDFFCMLELESLGFGMFGFFEQEEDEFYCILGVEWFEEILYEVGFCGGEELGCSYGEEDFEYYCQFFYYIYYLLFIYLFLDVCCCKIFQGLGWKF